MSKRLTVLETPEDLTWVREVHLRGCVYPPFEVAIIEGNEDAPTRLTLFERNHVNSLTQDWYPDAEGNFHGNRPRY